MNWYEEKIKNNKYFLSEEIISDVNMLYPRFRFLILRLFAEAKREGLNVRIYETYRSQARQRVLFERGHSELVKNGMHHFGIASDVVFLDEKDNYIWRGDWDKLGAIGRNLGLYWGGDWKTFKDNPHFQLVPATSEDQYRIISGTFPDYDKINDDYLDKCTSLYERLKNENWHNKYFNEFADYITEISL